jgi:hypothetical protein
MNAMRRSSRWRRGRRSDSRSTAPATERATTNLIAVPNADRPLSEGLVVEASVVARVFRIRLLAVDARVVISPAHVHGQSPAVPPRTQRRAIGARLVAAARFIDEGASSLAASRAGVPTANRSQVRGGV